MAMGFTFQQQGVNNAKKVTATSGGVNQALDAWISSTNYALRVAVRGAFDVFLEFTNTSSLVASVTTSMPILAGTAEVIVPAAIGGLPPTNVAVISPDGSSDIFIQQGTLA